VRQDLERVRRTNCGRSAIRYCYAHLQIVGENCGEATGYPHRPAGAGCCVRNGTPPGRGASLVRCTASDYVAGPAGPRPRAHPGRKAPLISKSPHARRLPLPNEALSARPLRLFGANVPPDTPSQPMKCCALPEGGKSVRQLDASGFHRRLLKAVDATFHRQPACSRPRFTGAPRLYPAIVQRRLVQGWRSELHVRYRSDTHWLGTFKTDYGTVPQTFESLDRSPAAPWRPISKP